MSVLFDLSAFIDYCEYVRSKGEMVVPFQKALDDFPIKKAVEALDKKMKGTVYVVPSVTKNKGTITINGKKFYEW